MREEQNYCDDLVTELRGWKTKASDVLAKFDQVASGDKEKILDQVRDLHMFVGELENRIEALRVECPVGGWAPGQVEMETKLTEKYIY